jgi:uncharacterized cupin superfamily protein
MSEKMPAAVKAADVPLQFSTPGYPLAFAGVVAGRSKARLGNVFGLQIFGVNLTRLAPGAATALRHYHSVQDEFVYVLEGHPVLIDDDGETLLEPGMCAGFKGGTENGHQLVNRTETDVVLLEVGDRLPGDRGVYPDDDLMATVTDGVWRFDHKDGSPY